MQCEVYVHRYSAKKKSSGGLSHSRTNPVERLLFYASKFMLSIDLGIIEIKNYLTTESFNRNRSYFVFISNCTFKVVYMFMSVIFWSIRTGHKISHPCMSVFQL